MELYKITEKWENISMFDMHHANNVIFSCHFASAREESVLMVSAYTRTLRSNSNQSFFQGGNHLPAVYSFFLGGNH